MFPFRADFHHVSLLKNNTDRHQSAANENTQRPDVCSDVKQEKIIPAFQELEQMFSIFAWWITDTLSDLLEMNFPSVKEINSFFCLVWIWNVPEDN